MGMVLGQFWAFDRAETVAIMPYRMLAVTVIVALCRQWPAAERRVALAGGLAAAGVTHGMAMLILGNPAPWTMLFSDLAFGVLVAALAEILLRGVRGWLAVAASALIAILAAPHALWLDLLTGRPAQTGHTFQLVTGLPLARGEGDIAAQLAGRVGPAASFSWLEARYAVVVRDTVAELGSAPVLIAQPRGWSPADLVRFDAWLRNGGRALILADPALSWRIELPPGDARRPAPAALLAPLFAHWGLRLEPGSASAVERRIAIGGVERKLALHSPGRFIRIGGDCRLSAGGLIADCPLGEGRAMLIADADLLDDRAWVGPGPDGARRERRLADNPQVLAGWLAALTGLADPAADDRVAWISGDD